MISSVLQAARSIESAGVRAYELLLDSRRRTSRGRDSRSKALREAVLRRAHAIAPCEELSSNKKTPTPHATEENTRRAQRRGEHRKAEV